MIRFVFIGCLLISAIASAKQAPDVKIDPYRIWNCDTAQNLLEGAEDRYDEAVEDVAQTIDSGKPFLVCNKAYEKSRNALEDYNEAADYLNEKKCNGVPIDYGFLDLYPDNPCHKHHHK